MGSLTPREQYEDIETRFLEASAEFTEAKAADERDDHMNKDFVARRDMLVEYINYILDEYLELRNLLTPLEINSA